MDKNCQDKSITNKAQIGVIGGGYWGKNLIRVFYQLGVLKFICDSNEELMANYRNNYPDVFFTTQPEELIKKNDIDAIVIATPASTHYSIAKISLEHNKHVFCEKPLALTVKEGEDLSRIAEEKNLILMVGHILHYHPAIKKLKQIIRNKELGDIEYMYSNRTNIGRIRHEENILWSFAPHDISLILSLAGCLPARVIAHGGIFLPHDVEDVTLTFLSFPNNVKAHIFVSWLNPFKEQKFVVIGTKKMAVFDDTERDNKLVLYQHKISWKENDIPLIEKAEAEIVETEKTEPLKEEAEHFIHCIETKEKPLTDAQEALNVLKVLEMAEHSLKESR
ncbi:MAG TPA: Gfo/Idh/MocA family oxidoreductase [bacterium]|nr:Gfo/Idh/MocA family oxidoreductase [bacterium]HOL49717.1 Gfo/Idh/MocA family oxidoreductase [bacterium]HPO51249.1 Gfo/Idh/MocA family oxidoreductase [bacterium]